MAIGRSTSVYSAYSSVRSMPRTRPSELTISVTTRPHPPWRLTSRRNAESVMPAIGAMAKGEARLTEPILIAGCYPTADAPFPPMGSAGALHGVHLLFLVAVGSDARSHASRLGQITALCRLQPARTALLPGPPRRGIHHRDNGACRRAADEPLRRK